MANWAVTIDISEPFKKCSEGIFTTEEAGKAIANILSKYEYLQDDELDEIADQFRSLDEESDDSDFDYILADLYDWGDTITESTWPTSRKGFISTF